MNWIREKKTALWIEVLIITIPVVSYYIYPLVKWSTFDFLPGILIILSAPVLVSHTVAMFLKGYNSKKWTKFTFFWMLFPAFVFFAMTQQSSDPIDGIVLLPVLIIYVLYIVFTFVKFRK